MNLGMLRDGLARSGQIHRGENRVDQDAEPGTARSSALLARIDDRDLISAGGRKSRARTLGRAFDGP
jgi:hypothetical protein